MAEEKTYCCNNTCPNRMVCKTYQDGGYTSKYDVTFTPETCSSFDEIKED